jgi:hypothetical protein
MTLPKLTASEWICEYMGSMLLVCGVIIMLGTTVIATAIFLEAFGVEPNYLALVVLVLFLSALVLAWRIKYMKRG